MGLVDNQAMHPGILHQDMAKDASGQNLRHSTEYVVVDIIKDG